MFDTSDFQRLAISSVGALALSTACVFAAVGPAKAATAPQTVADWQTEVASRIATTHEADGMVQPAKLTKSEVKVAFTADGDFAGATLARSSGNAGIDARAVKVASRIAYPALPQGMRGAPATVRMKLYFGNEATAADYAALQDRAAKNVQVASADTGAGIQIAAR